MACNLKQRRFVRFDCSQSVKDCSLVRHLERLLEYSGGYQLHPPNATALLSREVSCAIIVKCPGTTGSAGMLKDIAQVRSSWFWDLTRGTQTWSARDVRPNETSKGALRRSIHICGYVKASPQFLCCGDAVGWFSIDLRFYSILYYVRVLSVATASPPTSGVHPKTCAVNEMPGRAVNAAMKRI